MKKVIDCIQKPQPYYEVRYKWTHLLFATTELAEAVAYANKKRHIMIDKMFGMPDNFTPYSVWEVSWDRKGARQLTVGDL